MSVNQTPAAFITGLFETHLQVRNLERSMEFYEKVLGLEEKPPWTSETNADDQIVTQHFAFEIDLADLGRVVASMKQRGIELCNFFGEATDVASVFGWFPAASIYFNDPDGHLLEFVAKLPGKAKPEIGVVSMDEWNRLYQSAN